MALRWRVQATALAGLALVLASCGGTPSPVDPDADVRITGQVVDAQGAPVDGATVRVIAGGGFSDLLTFLPGIHYVCTVGGCDTTDESVRTGEDGKVTVETKGSETRTPVGNARDMAFLAFDSAEPPAGALGRGGSVQYFKVLSEQVALPALSMWRTALTTTAKGAQLSLRFDPVPGGKATYGWYVDDLQGNPLASVEDIGAGRTVDARLLEDFPGRMAVTARRSGEVDTRWRSAVFPVLGRLVPPSRGASCSRRDRAGRPTVQRPCTLTDGDLLTTGPGPIGDCVDIPESQATACRERVDPVDVDLGRARSVSLVVVRGVSSPVYVATSIDGRSWTEFGRALTEGGFVRASLTVSAAARSARYVRVNTVGEIPSEVSVW